MRVAGCLFLWVFAISPATAHDVGSVRPDTLWRSWSFDPLVIVPLLLALCLYGSGLRRLWTRAGSGRGVAFSQALSFAAGAAVLLVALISPLDPLGETLLSAHMVQHALLIAVAPLLLLFGKPGLVFAWALPAGWRRTFLGSTGWRSLAGIGDALSRPLPAAVLHALALWLWHVPAAFNAAVASYTVHALEHSAFLGTALLFWRAILDGRSTRRAGPALGASFATLMHGGLLGALITLAPYPLYAWYHGRTELWGFSALEDQQLAGLLMWVPMGIVYLAACLVLASRLVVEEERPSEAPVETVSLEKRRSAVSLEGPAPSRDFLRSPQSE
jgi:putative membrane protein